MRLSYGLAALLVLSATIMPAQAQGVVFVQKETRGNQSTTSRVVMDKDHIRAESRASGEESAFVFDGPRQTARMLNLTGKTYMEITKADLEQVKKQMDAMMAQMQNVPPAQRAMIEQMMQGRGMPGMSDLLATGPKVQYRQTGSDKVGQWTCTKYEGTVGGQKTTEVCTVEPKEFGLTPADFAIAQQLADFLKPMMPEVADRMFVNGTVQSQGFAGVPVRRTTFRNGALDSTTETTEFRRESLPAATFETPAGFTKAAMPLLGR
jgi:hypothetical protein